MLTKAPWSNVYGLARTVLATGTALTLAVNPVDVLFARSDAGLSICQATWVFSLSVFCWFPATSLELARWIVVVLLVVVASGWMPRFTGLLHWWLSASFFLSAVPLDGGDHITGILTLILVPLTLTDPRRWHWQAPPIASTALRWRMRALVGMSALVVVRIQMAGVYLHAFVAKMGVEEWADGTALYYWFTDHNFGPPRVFLGVLQPVLQNGISVVALTWGAILVEVFLFLGIAASPRAKVWLFWLGMAFHGLIAVGIGLWSFSVAMVGALILYLWPLDRPFNADGVRSIAAWVTGARPCICRGASNMASARRLRNV